VKYKGTWILSGAPEPEADGLTLDGLHALVLEARHKNVPGDAAIYANIVSGSNRMGGFTAKTEEEQ
jgi:hypothetical protein